MAFADVFLLLCLLFGGFACLVFMLRRPMAGAATADAALTTAANEQLMRAGLRPEP